MLIVLLCADTMWIWAVLITFRRILLLPFSKATHFAPEDGGSAAHTSKRGISVNHNLPHI
jgi:hypothetical protein